MFSGNIQRYLHENIGNVSNVAHMPAMLQSKDASFMYKYINVYVHCEGILSPVISSSENNV